MTAVDLLQSQATREEAFAALKSWILSAPSPPEEAVLDTPGTPENAFLYALSLTEEARSDDRARFALAGYRSTAPIEWLRLHAIEFFGLTVQVAGYATTNVTATNTSGNAYGPFDPGELRFVNDSTKAIYENTTVVSIQPAQLLPLIPSTVSIPVRAIDPGTASNAAIGEINRLEVALEGVTVTNPAAAITQDNESRESINARIDARIGLFGIAANGGLSTGGPATAVEAVARSGYDNGGGCLRADGTRVQVTRTKLLRDDVTGISTLYVADDDGPIDPSDLTDVENEVVFYAERICSRVDVENVTTESIAITATMTIRQTSLTNTEITNLVNAALPLAALGVPIGGFATLDACTKEYIEGAIRGALAGKAQIVTIAVTIPSADVPMLASDIAQFSLTSLSIARIA